AREQHLAVQPGEGVRRGQTVAIQDLEGRPELDLVVHFGLQLAVTERGERQQPTRPNRERLILGRETGRAARGAVGPVQLELADLRERPPGLERDAPRPGDSAERRPAAARTE